MRRINGPKQTHWRSPLLRLSPTPRHRESPSRRLVGRMRSLADIQGRCMDLVEDTFVLVWHPRVILAAISDAVSPLAQRSQDAGRQVVHLGFIHAVNQISRSWRYHKQIGLRPEGRYSDHSGDLLRTHGSFPELLRTRASFHQLNPYPAASK